jgi:catechol 2,3-dioxygenase-like lactoylglutathione lyase family enzyme
MIKVNAIDHLNITVSDLQASADFYGRLFGFEIAEDCRQDERPYVIMGRAGVGWLALHAQTDESAPEGGRINHWGFVVDDFDGLQDNLQSLGADVLYTDRWPGGVVEYPRSRSLYVADPDGNEIELTSHFGGALV